MTAAVIRAAHRRRQTTTGMETAETAETVEMETAGTTTIRRRAMPAVVSRVSCWISESLS